MKFPRLSELDRDQAKIYQGAPTTGTILIVGPPGTGKTIIAFHRAQHLDRLKLDPKVVMYNRVLKCYTSNRGRVAESVTVQTLHAWVPVWWSSMVNNRNVPMVSGDSFSHDWAKIQQTVLTRLENGMSANDASWGHLIVDEGQDFPEAMYAALKLVLTIAAARGAKPAPAITVLADENQRLQVGKNSTIQVIRQTLGLHEGDKNVFLLRKNYRNTVEIARIASRFFVGLASGIPDPPTRRGELPVVSLSDADSEGKNLNAFVEKIAVFSKAKRTDEIGVLVPNNRIRKSIVNRLKARLSNERISVQTYASGDKDVNSDELVFDQGGHVTVLNYASAKGLEFDSVFVVDPGALFMGGASELSAKMCLYVMCSRARAFLNLMLIKENAYDSIIQCLGDANGNYLLEKI